MQLIEADKYRLAAQTVAQQHAYGEMVSHEYLRGLLCCNPPETGTHDDFIAYSFELLQAMDSLKTELLTEYRILLSNVKGRGYLLVEPHQQTDFAMQKFISIVKRACQKAQDEMEFINYGLLTQEQRKRNIEAKAKLASAQSLTLAKIG